jgi:hypothetical protein
MGTTGTYRRRGWMILALRAIGIDPTSLKTGSPRLKSLRLRHDGA